MFPVTAQSGHTLSSHPCSSRIATNEIATDHLDKAVYNQNSYPVLPCEFNYYIGDWRATRQTLTDGRYQIINLKTNYYMGLKTWDGNASCPLTPYTPVHITDNTMSTNWHLSFHVAATDGGGFTITDSEHTPAKTKRYVAGGPQVMNRINICRLIPVTGNPDFYFISTNLESDPPTVICDPSFFAVKGSRVCARHLVGWRCSNQIRSTTHDVFIQSTRFFSNVEVHPDLIKGGSKGHFVPIKKDVHDYDAFLDVLTDEDVRF